jgi:mannose-6-phosphate isomerase-like protein (cupin superfamily)
MMVGDVLTIERGAKHRLANPGGDELVVIEVQLGDELDEDDIIRYEDDFDRVR